MKRKTIMLRSNRHRPFENRNRWGKTLGYDHRLIDGAVADQFMAFVKKTLEGWSEDVG